MPEQNDVQLAACESRIYVTEQDRWKASIKQDWSRDYCFTQNPGEDFYHLLLNG